MTSIQTSLLLALSAVAIWFCYWWWHSMRRLNVHAVVRPSALQLLIGFVTNFFDTLGISSFATTTALYRLRRVIPDELIPGTLNLGHALPVLAQAFIFIVAVRVAPMLLLGMILAAVAGSWLGSGIVIRLAGRGIQIGMGSALILAAALFTLANLRLLPGGGEATTLSGWHFTAAIATNFILGALMPLGVGLFGPCMITLSLLGMSPIVAFPIMMGSCAFLMPTASLRFLGQGRYSVSAALGLTVGGIPAVLIAAYLVKSLPLTTMRWLVIAVVLYAAVTMLWAGIGNRKQVHHSSIVARTES